MHAKLFSKTRLKSTGGNAQFFVLPGTMNSKQLGRRSREGEVFQTRCSLAVSFLVYFYLMFILVSKESLSLYQTEKSSQDFRHKPAILLVCTCRDQRDTDSSELAL